MAEQDDLLREFLVESYENLDRLDGEFVALEEDPGSTETLSSIFRTIHTIKGTCGFLELARLESVTHAGENLLSALRDGKVAVDDEVTTALLHLVDAVREMLAHIESTGEEADESYPELVATLERLKDEPHRAPSPQQPVAVAADPVPDSAAAASPPASESAGADPDPGDEPDSARAPVEGTQEAHESGRGHVESAISGSNIRVQVEQLDKLMNLAGELVLARNQILQSATSSQDAGAIATAHKLNLITTEMQERIMKVRMQPVGMLWSKFPRIVRDLAKQLGKTVRLDMEGKGTELDKTLLEAIKDPLTHLVRNAVDHGIEPASDRVAKGKEAEGSILLRAYHESGQVNIEIVDDGAGMDPEAIKQKAIAKGIVSLEEAARMNDRQVYALIFHAGLSTAKQITNVSGRGVGMDVVKTNIEQIGGAVEVMSSQGRGTTVRIKIPLTLAIVPALIVTTARDRYAIPQVNLVELVRLDGQAACTGIENLHGSPVYRLRGEILPLVFLDSQLRVEQEGVENEEPSRNIVVVRAADHLFGLVVDEINDTEEIVVKPLDQQTKSVPVYAGTTILGDGHVALILDVLGLARRAGVLAEDEFERRLDVPEERESGSGDTSTFLLFQGPGGRRLAIDLTDVARLEEFRTEEIEASGGCEVIQYRGEIMPLVRVSDVLGMARGNEPDPEVVQVVVHSSAGQSVGLVVEAITDIVEAADPVVRASRTPGIARAVVLGGHVTDQLDLDQVLGHGARAAAQALDPVEVEEVRDASVGTRQFCTFYLDDLFFGVDVTQVQEVLRHQPMTRVPLTSDVVRGLINLRGQTVTALDMRRRLGLQPCSGEGEPGATSMNLVLRTRDGIVSILVDRIGDVLRVEDTARGRVPNTVGKKVRALLTDVYRLPEALLLTLDIEQLVAVGEVVEAA